MFFSLQDALQCFLKFALLLQLYKDCLRLADYIGSKVRGQPLAVMKVLDDVCFILLLRIFDAFAGRKQSRSPCSSSADF